MSDSSETQEKKPEKVNWFIWWQIGEKELKDQVERYSDLKFFQSARGISVLLILISIGLTICLVASGYLDSAAYFDVILFVILGIFVALGHRWAMLAMMGLWTVEKGYAVITTLQEGTNNGSIVTQVIWWCFYMHAFYLASEVEKVRGKNKRANAAKSSTHDLSSELEKLAEMKEKGLINQRDYNAKKKKILEL